ncbi:MAG: hypothetical protein QME85_04070 [Candidatus Saccharicenans sp.]|nr:hypothetical protein [Candidatus Saccharicenans sp.]
MKIKIAVKMMALDAITLTKQERSYTSYQTIARLISIPLMSLIVLFGLELNAQTKEATAPKLTNLIITTDPNATSPSTCIQLLPDETITVYAVGLDEKGKPFVIPEDSIVHWSGTDGLEVKSSGSHTATVKLAKPLKAAVAKLSNHLSYDSESFGSSVQVSQKVKEMPKIFSLVFLKDPTKDKAMDVEKMKVGESIIVFLRGMSSDMATMGEVFTLPLDVNIVWKMFPSPPLGAEIKITPLGCHMAKIDIIKPGQMEGMPSSIKVEADFKDGTKREGAFVIEVTK